MMSDTIKALLSGDVEKMADLIERFIDDSELYDEMYQQAKRPNDHGARVSIRLRETAWAHNLKPIPARVWAKLPPNKRVYIIKTLPSVGRA